MSALQGNLPILRQALWDVYRELGFDTDGDDHFHGADEDLAKMLVAAAHEEREDYEAALEDLPNSVDVVKAAGYRVVKLRCANPEPGAADLFWIDEEL